MNHENERGVLYLTSLRDWVQLVRAPGSVRRATPTSLGTPARTDFTLAFPPET